MYLNLPFWAFQIAAGSQTFPSAKDSHVSECRPLSHYVCTFIVLKYRHMRVHSSLTLKHCASKHATHQSVYMHTHSQTFMYVCVCVRVCGLCECVCARVSRRSAHTCTQAFPESSYTRICICTLSTHIHTSTHTNAATKQREHSSTPTSRSLPTRTSSTPRNHPTSSADPPISLNADTSACDRPAPHFCPRKQQPPLQLLSLSATSSWDIHPGAATSSCSVVAAAAAAAAAAS
jgi:hypothetical protein